MMASRYFTRLRVFFTKSEMKMVPRVHVTIIHRKLSSFLYAVSPRICPYSLRRHKEAFHQSYQRGFCISEMAHSTLIDSEKASVLEHKQEKQSDGEVDEESVYMLSDEFVEELSGGDPEIKKKIKLIELEYEVLKQSGKEVPSDISARKWKELISLDSRAQRTRYFYYLFVTEKRILNKKAKKEEERRKREQIKETEDKECQKYSIFRNSLFQRIGVRHENAFYNNVLIQAMQFGQPLVFDCAYCDFMSRRETRNCADQLQYSFGMNRLHKEPFNLYLCNASRESFLMKELNTFIPPLYEPYFPLNITEKSYLDLFPKEKIVYLTPNSSEVMEVFDENAVYIIGALVDKTEKEPLSLAKAKREGLKMMKLPLDKYLNWGIGDKSLTLDQMVNILLEVHYTQDWKKALRFVPERKLKSHPSFQEQELRNVSARKKHRMKRESRLINSLFEEDT